MSSVDSLDWKLLSVDEMYNRVVNTVQNGSIILFHNGVENTPEALDKILTKLEKDGYEFVTVCVFSFRFGDFYFICCQLGICCYNINYLQSGVIA